MSEELRPCPFHTCDTFGTCGCYDILYMSDKDWNTRPIEDALNARIAELEAAQRWIPVSERLPEPYERVIGLAKDRMNVDWVLPKELRQVGKGAFARFYNVTHWMPLPPPPEGAQR